MRVFEVFAGCGGLAYGLHRAGFEHVGFCEIEPYPRRILQRHFPGVPVFGDVRELAGTAQQPALFAPKVPEFDVLAGGPPCQPASVAGSRGGSDDDRWLWGEFLDLVERYRPSLVFAENVAGLPTLNGGHEFGLILRRLASLGYVTTWDHCPAGSIGAPHIRDRVFLVARPGRVGGSGRLPARWPRSGRWDGDLTPLEQRWPKAKRGAWPWLVGRPAAANVTAEPGVGRLWPTPAASAMNHNEDPKRFLERRRATDDAGKTRPQGLNLGVAVRMWPTPQKSDAECIKTAGPGGNPSLSALAGQWESDEMLAPEFAEWLQGWPQGWTARSGPSLLNAQAEPWTNPEPAGVPRLTPNYPDRAHRLRCTGNGVCAPVAELLAELDWL